MDVRDAVEDDADAIASLADMPTGAARDLVHDRTVRVAVPAGDGDGDPTGYVAFDARRDAVHVTGLDGEPETIHPLLSEPIRFAAAEGMAVETLVENDDDVRRKQLEDAGFTQSGPGPRFAGSPTLRYRLPDDETRRS